MGDAVDAFAGLSFTDGEIDGMIAVLQALRAAAPEERAAAGKALADAFGLAFERQVAPAVDAALATAADSSLESAAKLCEAVAEIAGQSHVGARSGALACAEQIRAFAADSAAERKKGTT